jgi:hypothetical protein
MHFPLSFVFGFILFSDISLLSSIPFVYEGFRSWSTVEFDLWGTVNVR